MISTYKYSDDKPASVKEDHRGNKIKIGNTVVYNRSGQVVLGTLNNILKNEFELRKGSSGKDWILKFKLEIINEDGSIPILKNPNSFIMLCNIKMETI